VASGDWDGDRRSSDGTAALLRTVKYCGAMWTLNSVC
jgi:hypothetical protein